MLNIKKSKQNLLDCIYLKWYSGIFLEFKIAVKSRWFCWINTEFTDFTLKKFLFGAQEVFLPRIIDKKVKLLHMHSDIKV